MANEEFKRPDCVTEEHLLYLDDLRESGITNMYGAGPFVMDVFSGLTEKEATSIVVYWMETFGSRQDAKKG